MQSFVLSLSSAMKRSQNFIEKAWKEREKCLTIQGPLTSILNDTMVGLTFRKSFESLGENVIQKYEPRIGNMRALFRSPLPQKMKGNYRATCQNLRIALLFLAKSRSYQFLLIFT